MALQETRRRGPGMRPRVDGVAHGDVGAAGAFGAHVAFGGEAGHDVGFGGGRGDEGALRDGLLDGLQVLGAGVEEEVHVRVDEAGHEGGVAEVDDLRAGGVRDVWAGFADAFVPSTRTSPGEMSLPAATSSRCAAWSTVIFPAGCWAWAVNASAARARTAGSLILPCSILQRVSEASPFRRLRAGWAPHEPMSQKRDMGSKKTKCS